MALVFVMLTMLVVTTFATAGLAYAMNSQTLSRHDQDWNAALAAAQAGVDDYIAHLNRNDNYARTAAATPFTDCTNLAEKGPVAPVDNSCGWTVSTPAGWTYVSASSSNNVKRAAFHYDVDPSQLDLSGTVDVKSTGEVNGVRRTLDVAVGRQAPTSFLYYTDHEDADPLNAQAYPSGMDNRCYSYWYAASSVSPAGYTAPRSSAPTGTCAEIQFVTGDVLNGSVHTNDTPRISGNPMFQRGFETSDSECQQAVKGNASTYYHCDRDGQLTANPGFGSGYGPVWAPELDLQDNSTIFGTFPGCYYTGATRIIFNDNGTMNVWSKNTTTSNSTTTATCGGNAPSNAVVAVPANKVIYVRNDTSTHTCATGEIDGTLPLESTKYQSYYFNGDKYYKYVEARSGLQDQLCGQGNAYVEGVLQGRVTVAAQNSVIVTGDLTLHGGRSGPDLLGLVATNSVEVYHPAYLRYSCTNPSYYYACSSWNSTPDNGSNGLPIAQEASGWPHSTAAGLQIYGSIQTLQHSFYVQSYDYGTPQGSLTVVGSIAQKWRGIVSQSDGSGLRTGYYKDYQYDARLKFSNPPFFPNFQGAKWSGTQTGEIAAPGKSANYPDPS